ncbi:MAG: protein kinase [Gemmatimonadaceae bacterium]
MSTNSPGSHLRTATSLTRQVFVGALAIAVAVILAAFAAVSISDRHAADVATRRGLEQSADLVAQFLAGRERTLMGGARVFVQGPYFRTLVAERRRDDVLDQATEAAEQIGADWVFITDEKGALLAKSDEPGVFGASMGQVPLVAQALHGQVTSGFGASGDSALFQAVAVPIIARLGAPVGVLVATKIIDSQFMHDVKAATASDLLFYSRDDNGHAHAAAATVGSLDQFAQLLAELSKRKNAAATSTIRQAKKTEANDIPASTRIGNIDFQARGTALSTYGGEDVGGFLVLRASDATSASIGAIRTPLTVAILIGIAAALLSAWYAATRFTRPLQSLRDVVSRAAEGQLDASQKILAGTSSPEIQELSESFDALLHDLRDKRALIDVARLRQVAADPTPVEHGTSTRLSRVAGVRELSIGPSPQLQINRPGLVLQPGALLANRYVIEAEVGRGGLGIVYRARDRVVGETIAIKMLRPETVANDPTAFERLKGELRVTRKISHRNVVRTYDFGDTGDAPFLTMEYVDGSSLAAIIQARGPLSLAAVIAIAKQLLRALAVAHEHEVIHGDLKPQNLLIDANGLLKITDFGVARLMRGSRASRSSGERRSGEQTQAGKLRLTGAVLGTPEYMAPEQLIGEASSVRTDIYAAGAVLQECLSGTTPYSADTPIAFVARKMTPDEMSALAPIRIVGNASNAAIVNIVHRMIDPNAETRPASARELLARFDALE